MKTNIPQARVLLRGVLHRRNLDNNDRLDVIAALDLMTRHPTKVAVYKNPPMDKSIRARIQQELAAEDPAHPRQDVAIAVAAGLNPAGAARVSEIRNGVK